MAAVDIFVDVGVDLFHKDALTDGLEMLAHRLDFAGVGELVAELLSVDWVEEPHASTRGNPNPQPKPPPPPPPPPPKGWRS